MVKNISAKPQLKNGFMTLRLLFGLLSFNAVVVYIIAFWLPVPDGYGGSEGYLPQFYAGLAILDLAIAMVSFMRRRFLLAAAATLCTGFLCYIVLLA